jgi:hypothetical protein
MNIDADIKYFGQANMLYGLPHGLGVMVDNA